MVQTTESQSDVALKYFDHWSKKEYDASARYLDEHLSFTGPIDKFDNAQDYVQSIRRLAQIVTGVHRRKTSSKATTSVSCTTLQPTHPPGLFPAPNGFMQKTGRSSRYRSSS